MVNLGKLAKKAKDIADQQGDKIAKAVDKGTDLVDKRTKGKYSDKLKKVDGLAKKLDKTTQAGPAEGGTEPPSATPPPPPA